MQRTYSDTPEPRYVEKAKTAENFDIPAGSIDIADLNVADAQANQYLGTDSEGKAAWKDAPKYTTVGTLISTDGGFQLDYGNGGAILIPMEGTDDIIVDVDETNHKINIHLDADVRAKLAKVLTLPAQAPAATEFVGVGTNNAQKLMDASEARNALEVKKQVVLTATEYAAITTKDPNTLYLIVG